MILKLYQFAVNLLHLKMIASLNVDRRRARMAEMWLFQSKELNLNWLKNTTSQNDPREWNNEQFHNMCLYHECVNDSIFILSISFPDECHLLANGAILFRIAFIFIVMVTSLALSNFILWALRIQAGNSKDALVDVETPKYFSYICIFYIWINKKWKDACLLKLAKTCVFLHGTKKSTKAF